MQLKPNDLPPFVLGEQRNVLFKLGGAVGANTINDFDIAAVPANLGFGTPSINGGNVTVRVDADTLGEFTLVATAELSSGETVKGHCRMKVIEADCSGTRGYN